MSQHPAFISTINHLAIQAQQFLQTILHNEQTHPLSPPIPFPELIPWLAHIYALEQRIPSSIPTLNLIFPQYANLERFLIATLKTPHIPSTFLLILIKLLIYTLIKSDNPTVELLFANVIDKYLYIYFTSPSIELRCELTRLYTVIFSPHEHQPSQSSRINPQCISMQTTDHIREHIVDILTQPSELLITLTTLLFSSISTNPNFTPLFFHYSMQYRRESIVVNTPSFHAYKSYLLLSKLRSYDNQLEDRQRQRYESTPSAQRSNISLFPSYIQTMPPKSKYAFPEHKQQYAALNIESEPLLAYFVRFLHPLNSPYLHLCVLKLINSIITNNQNFFQLFQSPEISSDGRILSQNGGSSLKWWFQQLFFPSFSILQEKLQLKSAHVFSTAQGGAFPLINQNYNHEENDVTDVEFSTYIDPSTDKSDTNGPLNGPNELDPNSSNHQTFSQTSAISWQRTHRHYKKEFELKQNPYGLLHILTSTDNADILLEVSTLIYNILTRLRLSDIIEVIPIQLLAEHTVRKLHKMLTQTYSRIDSLQLITPQAENCINSLWLIILACTRFPITAIISPSNTNFSNEKNPLFPLDTTSLTHYLNLFGQFMNPHQPTQSNPLYMMLLDCIMLSNTRIVDIVIGETIDQSDLLERTGLLQNISQPPVQPSAPTSGSSKLQHNAYEMEYKEHLANYLETIRSSLRQSVVLLVNGDNTENGDNNGQRDNNRTTNNNNNANNNNTNNNNNSVKTTATPFILTELTFPACANTASLVCSSLFYRGYRLVHDEATLQQYMKTTSPSPSVSSSNSNSITTKNSSNKRGFASLQQPGQSVTPNTPNTPNDITSYVGNEDQLVLLGGDFNPTVAMQKNTKSLAAAVSIPREFSNPIQTTLTYLDYILQTDYANPPLHHTTTPPVPFTPEQLEKSCDYSSMDVPTGAPGAWRSKLTSHYDVQRSANPTNRPCTYLANINCLYDCINHFLTQISPSFCTFLRQFYHNTNNTNSAQDRMDQFSELKLYLLVNHIRKKFILPSVAPQAIQEAFYRQYLDLKMFFSKNSSIILNPSRYTRYLSLYEEFIKDVIPTHTPTVSGKTAAQHAKIDKKKSDQFNTIMSGDTSNNSLDQQHHHLPGISNEQYELFSNIHACPSCSHAYMHLSPLSNLDYLSPSSLTPLTDALSNSIVLDEPGNTNICSDIFLSTNATFCPPRDLPQDQTNLNDYSLSHFENKLQKREFPEFSLGLLFLPKVVNIVFLRYFSPNTLTFNPSPRTTGESDPTDPEAQALAAQQILTNSSISEITKPPLTAFTITPLSIETAVIQQPPAKLTAARENLWKNEEDATSLVQWLTMLLMYHRLATTRIHQLTDSILRRRSYYKKTYTISETYQLKKAENNALALHYKHISPIFNFFYHIDKYKNDLQAPLPEIIAIPILSSCPISTLDLETQLRADFSQLIECYTERYLPAASASKLSEYRKQVIEEAKKQPELPPHLKQFKEIDLSTLQGDCDTNRTQFEAQFDHIVNIFRSMYSKYRSYFVDTIGGDETLHKHFNFEPYLSPSTTTPIENIPLKKGKGKQTSQNRHDNDTNDTIMTDSASNTTLPTFHPIQHALQLQKLLQLHIYPLNSMMYQFVLFLSTNPFIESILLKTLPPSTLLTNNANNAVTSYSTFTLNFCFEKLCKPRFEQIEMDFECENPSFKGTLERIERYNTITTWNEQYLFYLRDVSYTIVRALKQMTTIFGSFNDDHTGPLKFLLNDANDLPGIITSGKAILTQMFSFRHLVRLGGDTNFEFHLFRCIKEREIRDASR